MGEKVKKEIFQEHVILTLSIIKELNLKKFVEVPHPRLCNRNFVLFPLFEIEKPGNIQKQDFNR